MSQVQMAVCYGKYGISPMKIFSSNSPDKCVQLITTLHLLKKSTPLNKTEQLDHKVCTKCSGEDPELPNDGVMEQWSHGAAIYSSDSPKKCA